MSIYYQTHAICLRLSDVNENDKFLTLLTKDYGKVTALAVGAHKIHNRLLGNFQPPHIVNVQIVSLNQTKIIGAEIIERFDISSCSYMVAFSIMKVLKITDKMIEQGISDFKIFENLSEVIRCLYSEHDEKNVLFIISVYTLKLLNLLGYKPELSRCLVSSVLIRPGKNYFSPKRGGVVSGSVSYSNEYFIISDNAVRLMKASLLLSFVEILKIRKPSELDDEFISLIRAFSRYRTDRELL